MNEQIIKVEADPKDQACTLITLRHMPNRLIFWKKKQSEVLTYKGHGNHWYQLPCFTSAPSKLIPLLKEISSSPQFEHLRPNTGRRKI